MVQSVSGHPLCTVTQVRSQGSPRQICGRQSGTGTGFSPSTSVFPVITIPSRLCIYLHFNTVLIRTNGWILGTSEQRYALSHVSTGQKVLCIQLC